MKSWSVSSVKGWASAYTLVPQGSREQVEVQEADLARMGDELVFHLQPSKPRR